GQLRNPTRLLVLDGEDLTGTGGCPLIPESGAAEPSPRQRRRSLYPASCARRSPLSALSRIEKAAAVTKMSLTLSADHRVFDGQVGAWEECYEGLRIHDTLGD
ncbi:hypothetical protein EJB05_03941, partial [Eragrostis curvula]